ncbi:hypothetical protein KIKIMORA_04450 [Brevundimonas phage vB_BpoS-Kikimora]|uniref:Uncharacterized protein n=2 Tax=Kikimoravirus TaxID=3425051 RepID=A0A9E7N2B2_9CAUD|nr:hypothetical protein KIKIMORA_04450 [Brevundimonas phage vB_BpoS-Kikimora]UTC28448.1 hypothetical protein GURKE_04460 [Brevundimonas phage vB_BpoS-Gurke]
MNSTNPIVAAVEAAVRQAATIARETKSAAAVIFLCGLVSGCVFF